MPMPIATLIPGATYSSSSFTIPWSALNSILTTSVTAADDSAKLMYALAQVLYLKQQAGTVLQTNLAAEVAAKSVTTGVWETSTNNFTSKYLVNHLLSFPLDSITSEAGNSITSI